MNGNAIIFGANGQDGYYLNQLLVDLNYNVIGVSKNGNFLKTDITNYNEVAQLIQQYSPKFVFHLAANSTTNHNALFENHQTISTGTLNILEAVKNFSENTKVFISGSGLQFVNNGNPIKETDLFEARDAYTVSRIQSVYASRYYRRQFDLKVYVGYFFNHDSPRRSERHINKKIIETAKRIKNGSKEKLLIGDLSVKKEFGDSEDIVKGIMTLINQEEIFEATIGTGNAYSIKDWVEIVFNYFGLNWEEHIEKSTNFKSDYKILVSNPSTINNLGWQPKFSIEDLAKKMCS